MKRCAGRRRLLWAMRRFVLASALAGPAFAAPPPTAADPGLDGVLAALAQRRHGHASFEQWQYLALLDRPLQSSGELIYDAPDRLEMRTLKPRPEDLIVQGNRLTVARGRHQRALDLRQYPQLQPFVGSIRATLAGDRPALEQLFTLAFAGGFEHWTMVLTPLPPLAAAVTQIRIEGRQDQVDSVDTAQADGDHSHLSIGPAPGP
jgi:hypothetical protein